MRLSPKSDSGKLYINGIPYDVSNLLLQPKLSTHRQDERIYPQNRLAMAAGSPSDLYTESSSFDTDYQRKKPIRSQSQSPGLNHLEAELTAKSSATPLEGKVGRKKPPSYSLTNNQQQQLQQPQHQSSMSSPLDKDIKKEPYHGGDQPVGATWAPKHGIINPAHSHDSFHDHDSESSMLDMPSSQRRDNLTVEIAPGVMEVLRGSQETSEAMSIGNIAESTCFCCTLNVSHIADAAFFLCPACRVICPTSSNNNGKGWGVGLGFVNQ